MIDDDWMSDDDRFLARLAAEGETLVRKSELDALRAENERLRVIRAEYRNRLKQFGADDDSLDGAEQDAIARAALKED